MAQELQQQIDELRKELDNMKKQSLFFPLDKKSKDIIKSIFKKEGVEVDGEKGFLSGDSFHVGLTLNMGESNEVNRMLLITGDDRRPGLGDVSGNSQITLENHTGSTNQSFFYGFRAPIYQNDGQSITASGNTLQDGRFQWDTDELAGAYIVVLSSAGSFLETQNIDSNTSDTITIEDTWINTESDATYFIFMPVYLGSADYPWRRVYTLGTTGGGIRFDIGTTGGGQNTLLYMDRVSGDLFYRELTGTGVGDSTTQFDITNPSGDTMRYTYDGTGTDPSIDASSFPIGTQVTINAENFDSNNNGVATLTGSGSNYFEIENENGVVESDKTIGSGSITKDSVKIN